ncbi:apoptosis-associated speck-like protein containing a CARD [Brienomyrus brachyistius]|uniref:apoptosis-associated speck-like protein containing a CARD n=1 Tax=Brienomyrus brachyistius TaxID=42636 RepID=UPI0020B40FAF|nr:apoptosis-associated speck-like protein containing a CARD [Brienomyrus brachyistius]
MSKSPFLLVSFLPDVTHLLQPVMEKSVLDRVIDALDGLSADNFKRFKVKLCEPRIIRYGQIEEGSTVDVAQRIVSVFTKAAAVSRTADVLRAIGLNEDAEALEEEDAAVCSAVGGEVNPGEAGKMGGASGHVVNGKHFVDRNMTALINRVSLVPPILDQLYESGFMQHELYMEICDEKSSFKQMRSLMLKVIMPGGSRAKDELCRILENQQKYLMEELKGQ